MVIVVYKSCLDNLFSHVIYDVFLYETYARLFGVGMFHVCRMLS